MILLSNMKILSIFGISYCSFVVFFLISIYVVEWEKKFEIFVNIINFIYLL